eukprot:Opistho-1_new@76178
MPQRQGTRAQVGYSTPKMIKDTQRLDYLIHSVPGRVDAPLSAPLPFDDASVYDVQCGSNPTSPFKFFANGSFFSDVVAADLASGGCTPSVNAASHSLLRYPSCGYNAISDATAGIVPVYDAALEDSCEPGAPAPEACEDVYVPMYDGDARRESCSSMAEGDMSEGASGDLSEFEASALGRGLSEAYGAWGFFGSAERADDDCVPVQTRARARSVGSERLSKGEKEVRRREKNKASARKFRARRDEETKDLRSRVAGLLAEHRLLRDEKAALQRDICAIKEVLLVHFKGGCVIRP